MLRVYHTSSGPARLAQAAAALVAAAAIVAAPHPARAQTRSQTRTTSGAATVASSVVSPDLLQRMQAHPSAPQRVIVQTSVRPSAADLSMPGRYGGRVTAVFNGVAGYAAVLPPVSVHRLAARPGVRRIVPDRPVAGFKKLPKGGYASGWDDAARSVGADLGWYRPTPATGVGVGVAVLDTGIALLPDIRVAGWVDLVNGRPTPYDDNGHGTHVSGIVAGNGAMSGYAQSRFLGMAPGAYLFGVKVLDANANGYASTVIQGIDWCIANKVARNIRVINLSLGQPVVESYTTDPLCLAVERAVAAGIVVVAAAGNNGGGYGGIESPGNHPAVITVGASRTGATPFRSDDAVAGYSSRGPTAVDRLAKPDLLAPGNHIVSLRVPGSTIDVRYPGNRVLPYLYGGAPTDSPRYTVLSGTSMAAPVVAGIAAQVIQLRPDLSPNAVKAALMVSAQPLGGYDPVLRTRVACYDWMTSGAGYVNGPGALTAALTMRTGTTAPASWGADTIQGEAIPWGFSVLWGNVVVDAEEFSRFNRVDWNRSVLWGDSVDVLETLPDEGDAVTSTSVLWGNAPYKRLNGLSVLVSGESDATGG